METNTPIYFAELSDGRGTLIVNIKELTFGQLQNLIHAINTYTGVDGMLEDCSYCDGNLDLTSTDREVLYTSCAVVAAVMDALKMDASITADTLVNTGFIANTHEAQCAFSSKSADHAELLAHRAGE